MKKIGIIGSGIVAQTLGIGFIKHGYAVMLGTRDASKLKDWQNENGQNATVGTFLETAKFADIIVLAVKGTATLNALKLIGAENLNGKTVIDATNPIADAPPENGVIKFFTKMNESLMEQLQASFPQANFVKAFNSVGSAFMINPAFKNKPTMFICGNNDEAKQEVSQILELFGWEVADFGTAKSAGAIEALCMLWCIPGFLNNQWSHAFNLLKN